MESVNLKFGLFWSGSKLSYLRYLTFVSLRKFHPDSEIELYTTDNYSNKDYNWGCEKQDFENEIDGIDYMAELHKLDVKIIKTELFDGYPSNYQSDLFRWWWLKNNSGFYLDTDQIILRSFADLNRDFDFICPSYMVQSCGHYTPV